MHRPQRGFSLVEVAVAMAMAGIIGVAAISAFAALNQQLVQLQRENVANDVAKSTIDALVTRLQSVGGGPVRPHMALWVEDDEDPVRDAIFKVLEPRPLLDAGRDGADRVTYARLIPEAPVCTIKAMTAATVSGEVVDGVCCLSRILGKDLFANVYLVNGTSHKQVALTPPVLCVSSFFPGPLAAIDSTPAATPASLTGGSIAAVTVKTIYLNDSRDLVEFEQKTFDGGALTLDKGSSEVVCSDAFDFQVQLGYDVNADGRLNDLSGNGDEWQYNAVNDRDAFQRADLRMAGVSVVVGVAQVIKRDNTVEVVGNRPLTRTNYFLRSAAGRASFRNIFVFN